MHADITKYNLFYRETNSHKYQKINLMRYLLGISLLLLASMYVTQVESNRHNSYDQIGDNKLCFTAMNKCMQEQKLHEVSESDCYYID